MIVRNDERLSFAVPEGWRGSLSIKSVFPRAELNLRGPIYPCFSFIDHIFDILF